jgi:5-methylcytosine-specific restriction endonuclease McrA
MEGYFPLFFGMPFNIIILRFRCLNSKTSLMYKDFDQCCKHRVGKNIAKGPENNLSATSGKI